MELNVLLHINDDVSKFVRYSSFYKLIRCYSFCFRFYNTSKLPRVDRTCGPLLSEELLKAKRALNNYVQRLSFPEEHITLERNFILQAKSKLLCLFPFLNEGGTMRVGGRLKNSQLKYISKHQALLPYGHPFTNLVIRHFHVK